MAARLREARQLKHTLDHGDFDKARETEFGKDYDRLTGGPLRWYDGGSAEVLSDRQLMTLRYLNQPFGPRFKGSW